MAGRLTGLKTFGPAMAALVALAALVAVEGRARTAVPTQETTSGLRVVSASLCADQYVLLLADRAQIASVSRQAGGDLSPYAERARGLPTHRGDLEAVIAAAPDLVVLDDGSDAALARGLDHLGVPSVRVASGATFEEIEASVMNVAEAMGRVEAGARIVAELRERRARLAADRPAPDDRPVVAYFRADGGGAGAGTLVDTVLDLAGFRNIQALAGQTGWRNLNLEEAALDPPQAYVVSFGDTNRHALIAALGRNPILRRAEAPVIEAPGKYWACSGPAAVEAAEGLARARLTHFPDASGPRVPA